MKTISFAWIVALIITTGTAAAADVQLATQGMWTDVPVAATAAPGMARPASAEVTEAVRLPEKYRLFGLDKAMFLSKTAAVPPASSMKRIQSAARAAVAPVELAVPFPDGSVERFAIVENGTMAPELAAKFPEIKTWSGQGIDDPSATITLDFGPLGFHGMVLSPSKGRVFIDPYRGVPDVYIGYFARDLRRPADEIDLIESDVVRKAVAGTLDTPVDPGSEKKTALKTIAASPHVAGTQLRTYRLAVATTGEYTTYHTPVADRVGGLGTVPFGLAAVVAAVNRVNGIYERELAVRLTLIGSNNLIIYTDGSTDPYSNSGTDARLVENRTNLTNVIGDANFDIGHVFATGGSGKAALAAVCAADKAEGTTGKADPTGDAFWVDYVAHEIGHQFGAEHSFNGTISACSNRAANYAYEPGSGSTIMGYAAICGADDIQAYSDPYFHTDTFQQIRTFLTTPNYRNWGSSGLNCGTLTATGNNPPVPNAQAGKASGFTIPANTPFTLTGAATDPDSDPLTYAWEEYNLGVISALGSTANPPFFRSWPPTASPSRTFPRMAELLNNTTPLGETLPNVTRAMSFRLTARDNRAGGGGVDYDTLNFNVTTAAGPFKVTAPVAGANLVAGSNQTVTWDVANTNAAPVNCPNVDISVSTDGGTTFATVLAATPNDGSEVIALPNTSSFAARVKVACSDNVFFAISSGFQIGATTLVTNGFESNGTGWASVDVSSTSGDWTFLATGPHPAAVAPHGGTTLADFNSYTASSGRQTRLYQTSGTAIAANAGGAALDFWMYRDTEWSSNDDTIQAQISTDAGASWINVGGLNHRYDGTTGWKKVTLDVTAYKGQTVQIGFLATSGHGNDIYLDDVSLVTLAAAAPSVPGVPTAVAATVGDGSASVSFAAPASDGGAAINDYRVSCTVGVTANGAASPIAIALSNGSSHTCTVAAHNANGWSAESASIAVTPSAATAPSAPTIGVATPGNTQLSLAFTAPASPGTLAGGAAATITGYNASCSPTGSGSGFSSPITVTGLANGTGYTCTVTASNSVPLTGPASAASASVTPTGAATTVPGAPTIGAATAGNATASVTFSAPANDGGVAIDQYRVTCTGGRTASGTGSPISVALVNGNNYTCTVAAHNGNGWSAESAPSNSVKPLAPQTASVNNSPVAYDGIAHVATVVCQGGGAASGISTGGAATQTNVGTYAVTANCPENNGYASANGIAAGNFVISPQKSANGTAPSGSAIAATITTGPANCGFVASRFQAANTLGVAPPPGVTFPMGIFDFTTNASCGGSSITFTITYPSSVAGMTYWKYGKSPNGYNCSGAACATRHWYQLPATVSGNQVTFTVTDGGLGDDDLTVDNVITDPGGPGLPAGGAGGIGVPTLSEWGLIILSLLMAVFGLRRVATVGRQSH